MKKAHSSKVTQPENIDAPNCDAYIVNLENVRQVQPEIVSIEKAQQMAEAWQTAIL